METTTSDPTNWKQRKEPTATGNVLT